VTYQGQSASSTNTVLKVLVVVTIILVAYWAATGGLDQITTSQPSQSTTATTLSE